MKKIKLLFIMQLGLSILMVVACKSDPVLPNGGLPLDPPVQDPGEVNLCEEGEISFQHEVLPIMVSACAYSGCHDAISAEDDVILDNYDNIRKEVRPGNPNDSKLYESIVETDRDDIMPPPPASPLTAAQITIIRTWINQGAEHTDCGTSCDSNSASFAIDVYPIIQNYCLGCHNSARSDGGVNMESYDKILPYVENGSLLGTIRHDSLYIVMPPAGSQLSDCRIAQVEKWIAEGAENN